MVAAGLAAAGAGLAAVAAGLAAAGAGSEAAAGRAAAGSGTTLAGWAAPGTERAGVTVSEPYVHRLACPAGLASLGSQFGFSDIVERTMFVPRVLANSKDLLPAS